MVFSIGRPRIPTTNDQLVAAMSLGYVFRYSPSPSDFDQEGLIIGCAEETENLPPLTLCRKGYPVIVNIENLTAPIMIITGKSGSGKSTLAKFLISQLAEISEMKNSKMTILIIDMIGEYYYYASRHGKVYLIGDEASIDPFAAPGDTPEEKAAYLESIFVLSGLVRRDATRQRSVLREALYKLYTEAESGGKRPDLPALSQKIQELSEQKKELKESAVMLKSTIDSLIAKEKGFRRGKPIDLLSIFTTPGLVDIDLSAMSVMESKKFLVFLILYNLITWMRIQERPLSLIAVLDEAHNIIKMKTPEGTEHPLSIIAREGRKHGVGMILITQEIADILTQEMQDLYNNAGMWLFGSVTDRVISFLLKEVIPENIYPEYKSLLKRLGEGVPFNFILKVTWKDRSIPPTLIKVPKFFEQYRILLRLELPAQSKTIADLEAKIHSLARREIKRRLGGK